MKAERLPEPDGAFIGAHDEIELHGAIAPRLGVFERVQAHLSCNAAARGMGMRHIATIADVCAAARLVGPQVIGAEYGLLRLGDKGLLV